MKLLFDENLSYRLVDLLADIYPGSVHVRNCGLRGDRDPTLWDYAAQSGLTVVSKDSDFWQRSSFFGSPPKVIWLRIGNCTTARAEFVLRNAHQRVEDFGMGREACLVLSAPKRT